MADQIGEMLTYTAILLSLNSLYQRDSEFYNTGRKKCNVLTYIAKLESIHVASFNLKLLVIN